MPLKSSCLYLGYCFLSFVCILVLVSWNLPSTAYAANLLQVRDVLSYPQTASRSAHNLYFSSPSTTNDGFFRILISDSFTFTAPITVSGTNTTGYTFSGGVATASSGYHNFEIHYSGSGPAGTNLNLTIDSLTNPATQNAYSYILSQYDSLANLINQSTGRVSIHNNPSVTAHVPDYAVSNPILISPSDFAITNNPYEPFSFIRSYSIPGVDYYDLYLDDQLVAGNIDHDLLTQDYYFFKTLRSNETIHILLKQPLSEGTHTWYVKAYGVSGSTKNATSGKRSFTVDSTSPQIILTSIDNQILNWIVPDRTDIIVRSSNPFFKGKVEALSNLKLSLICPPGVIPAPSVIPAKAGIYIEMDSRLRGNDKVESGDDNVDVNCTDQSITIFEEDGNWEHRFHNLIANHRYEVYLAATDKAGNSHIFPTFYITYEPFSIISYIFPTPTDTPPLTSPPSEGGDRVGVSPTPPPQPSLSPEKFLTSPTSQPVLSSRFLEFFYYLTLFGLLLHILMTLFGSAVPIRQHLPFLWRLLFPFFSKPNRQTVISTTLSSRAPLLAGFEGSLSEDKGISPLRFASVEMTRYGRNDKVIPLPFTTLQIFNPSDLHQKPYLYTSNILGRFALPDDLSSQILLRLTRPGFIFKDQLIHHQTLLAISELNLERKGSPNALERLQLASLAIRWLPLLVADLTGLLYLSLTVPPCHCVTVSPFVFVYLLISLQLTYSEYIYPFSVGYDGFPPSKGGRV